MLLAGEPKDLERIGIQKGQPMSEAQIQKAVFQNLRERAPRKAVFWHTPNDKYSRSKAGYLAGVHDVIVFHNKELFTLELKKIGETPTEEQLEFMGRINAAGGYSFWAQGLDGALSVLKSWGLLR